MVWNYITNQCISIGYYLFPIMHPYFFFFYKQFYDWHFFLFPKKPIIIEPTSSEWIHISSLIYCNSTYQLVITDIISEKKDIITEYYSFYKSFYSNYDYNTTKENNITKEHLFIAKLKDNSYICRVCFPNHVKFRFDSNTNTNTHVNLALTLLYIEYSHPKMQTPIPLPFHNDMWQVYNELFTPTFILRQLQTQTEYYYFDMDYTLTILDSNLVTIHLKNTQYLLLQPNAYEIIQR